MKRNLPTAFYSTLKRSALAGFLFLGMNNFSAIALPAGFQYRTIPIPPPGNTSKSWHDFTIWERSSDGNTWSTISSAADIPDATAEEIVINNGYIIVMQNALTVDQLTVEAGGTLDIAAALTLPANAQQGLIVDGLLAISNGGSLFTNRNVVTGAGEFFLDAGGTLEIGAPEGIQQVGNLGTIQVIGDRLLDPAATYIYAGTSAQVTGSGLPTSVNNLVINNAQGVTLSQPLEIAANLQLTEGKLITGTNSLTVASTATVTPAAANKNSFVEGALAIKAATSKTLLFPIGKGSNYRPVTLNIVSTAGENTYTAEQFDQEFAVPAGTTIPEQVNKISGVRHFHIAKSGGFAVTANLTLTYGTDDNVTDAGNLALVKYDATNGWTYLGGSGTANGTGSISSGNFSTFSNFMLANQNGGSNPLPVELIAFTARNSENAVMLNWITATEQNSSHFEIERSANAKSFEKIGELKTGENSAKEKRYAFTDKNPMSGLIYYRLKQVDLDGSFTYSGVVTVKKEKTFVAPVLYPNPVVANLTIKAPGAISNVKIMNLLGQEIYNQNVNATEQVTLQVASLPAGAYMALLQHSGQQSVIKFLKAAN